MMRIFGQNAGQILDQFSKEFEKGFLQILSHSHGTKQVSANRIYQEYIADKQHVHMNATIWTTLTGFCKYLGKEGKCEVEETEKGWFIKYIDRDPQVLLRQAQRDERKQSELNEEEINKQIIDAQVKAAFERARERQGEHSEEYSENGEQDEIEEGLEEQDEVNRSNEKPSSNKPIQLKLNSVPQSKENQTALKKRSIATAFDVDDENENQGEEDVGNDSGREESTAIVVGNLMHYGRKMGNSFEQLRKEVEQRKKPKPSYDQPDEKNFHPSTNESLDSSRTWLQRNLVVKIIDKDSKYYKCKGIIQDVWRHKNGNYYEADVKLIDDSRKYVIFREDLLETVVPKVGESGILLRGTDRGRKVKVLEIHIEKYNCDVEFMDDGRRQKEVEYEDICKFNSSD